MDFTKRINYKQFCIREYKAVGMMKVTDIHVNQAQHRHEDMAEAAVGRICVN
jgi:hypothetical protein